VEIQTISQVVLSCIYTPKGVTLEGTVPSHNHDKPKIILSQTLKFLVRTSCYVQNMIYMRLYFPGDRMGAVQPDCCHHPTCTLKLPIDAVEGTYPNKGTSHVPLGSCRLGCKHNYGRDWLLLWPQVLVGWMSPFGNFMNLWFVERWCSRQALQNVHRNYLCLQLTL